jgi:hypothetical protein
MFTHKIRADELDTVHFARGRYLWADFVLRNLDETSNLNIDVEDCEWLTELFEEEGFPLLNPNTELFKFLMHSILSCA